MIKKIKESEYYIDCITRDVNVQTELGSEQVDLALDKTQLNHLKKKCKKLEKENNMLQEQLFHLSI